MTKHIEVKTYADLTWLIQTLFVKRKAEIVTLMSRAGLGKTDMVENMMKDSDYGYVNSHITPLMLYELGYRCRNKPIVVDDIDSVLNNEDNVSLIKQFAETKAVKRIKWRTSSSALEGLGIPAEFETTSNIMFIGNRVKKVASLMDRGFCLFFNPNRQEIIRKIEEIAGSMKIEKKKRSEIIEMFKTYDGDITLRTFMKALSLYGEKNWKDWLLKSMQVSEKTIICEKIVRTLPRNRWLEAWKFIAQQSGNEWSRTSFYDHLRKLNLDTLDTFDTFDIEKTLVEFQKQVEMEVRHPLKMQNSKGLSQIKEVDVSNKSLDAYMREQKNAVKDHVDKK